MLTPFSRATPESQGVSSRDIAALLASYLTGDLAEEPHSFLLLRHGKLLASGAFAPYSLRDRNTVFSCSKAFAGIAAGFAVAEGLFGYDDRVADRFPECLPPDPDPAVFRIRVRHLLTMTVGMAGEVIHEGAKRTVSQDETDWAEEFFRRPCEVPPGSEFRYDSFATYMLSRLILKTAGCDLLDYLRPRLFDPLGMDVPPCIRDKNGIPIGWTGLRLTIGELARVGQLFLDDGVWNGRRVLPEGFVREATKCHIGNRNATGADWSQGYCFQFWRGQHNTYRFCGALGQMCVVMPDLDAVFVIFSGCSNPNIHNELEAFYDLLMNRFQSEPLPPDPEGNARLDALCRDLSIRETYATPSPLVPDLSGRTLPLAPGTPFSAARFDFAGDAVTVTLLGGDPVAYPAGLREPLRARVFSAGTVALKTDFDTVYSSTAYFPSATSLRVTTHVIASPTDLVLEADFASGTAALRTVRGMFDM